MLMIEQGRRFPPLARIGLIVMLVGAVTEITMSLTASPHAMHAMHQASGLGHIGHLVALAGMVLVLAGVVTFGVRRQQSGRASAVIDSGGLETNAHR